MCQLVHGPRTTDLRRWHWSMEEAKRLFSDGTGRRIPGRDSRVSEVYQTKKTGSSFEVRPGPTFTSPSDGRRDQINLVLKNATGTVWDRTQADWDPDASYDINGNDSDPMPRDNGDNKHGTRCAGEVAAVAFNNYCGVGVAYNASIGGTDRDLIPEPSACETEAVTIKPRSRSYISLTSSHPPAIRILSIRLITLDSPDLQTVKISPIDPGTMNSSSSTGRSPLSNHALPSSPPSKSLFIPRRSSIPSPPRHHPVHQPQFPRNRTEKGYFRPTIARENGELELKMRDLPNPTPTPTADSKHKSFNSDSTKLQEFFDRFGVFGKVVAVKSESVPELESVELGLFEDPESELRSELANSEKLEPESKSARFEKAEVGEPSPSLGVRMLDGTVNDAVEAKALGLNPDHIHIYSASWGPEDDGSTVDGPGPLARRAFIFGVTSGRQGKGSIFIWASGNGGRYTDSCNCDGYTNSIFTLSISSATQGGYKPWYLEECSSTLATTYSSGTPGHDKSVATVDMDGSLRPDRICTVEHTGTSASAPLAAGISALALEANPSLTWRDMQYLVVLTSRPEPLEKESGWILNGVKRKVSHKFGYGLMDAGSMVSLAEQWTSVPPQHICKSREINEDRPIEGSVGYTLQTHMDVNGCAGTVNEVRFLEHVQCKITLRFFPRGNLRILLTSPMGTTSTLLFERPRDVTKSNFDDWPFLSVHFWGEKAEGRWTLQILNGGHRRVSQPGILSKWQLIFYGTDQNPIRLKSDGQRSSGAYSNLNPFVFPTETDINQPSLNGGNYYQSQDLYSNSMNYPYVFAGAGSSIDKSVTTLNGHNIPTAQRENVMADSNNKLVVLHDCDPECDQQGCYGKGPTQCVACKHYRLDNTCVSRCPPRSFPNQGGVCWPCHESCETCAGAGQDSCLTCAPAHLYVTDLAVCLQICPDGYFEILYGLDHVRWFFGFGGQCDLVVCGTLRCICVTFRVQFGESFQQDEVNYFSTRNCCNYWELKCVLAVVAK
ncbi:proprotein convertase subtilisin/kexin type 4, furin [Culex quinquefasciatus]|uniref:Proprotein convertase subtilisin/kexin type 4, furin n=1 Tax=Culex quinquefasciatus TaxID=7176 RepID=B0X798_CULQU|nr:proprotein convertase subtilisin/kexin type 4, furin [Culex quinquefasciatus]|eukprot:XP_001865520.1 proprotein convertase subtilisin/kexin type 4, furin [Culex quinquefasciatus]